MTISTSTTDKLSAHDVLTCLKQVKDPATSKDVVSAGLISGVTIQQGKVGFLITIDPKDKDSHVWLREACEQAVLTLPGVASVTAVLTAHNAEPLKPEAGSATPRERAVWNLTPLPHVEKIIAVASGKGGVGKSTVAAHLAMALAVRGASVGLLDADIYGPSVPTMFNISGKPDIADGMMLPKESHGVRCMSIGLITGDEAAILRGPMISKSLQQMLRLTRWGTADSPLDFLLIDMPPGTGDVHLSLVQQVPVSGAILVTTPQKVALKDAEKCARMFEKVGVPILGVVENMSYIETGSSGRQYVFGEGGGAELAAFCRASLLAEIPVDAAISSACDAGESLFANIENAAQRVPFEHLASMLLDAQLA